jgi:hypothetical protein
MRVVLDTNLIVRAAGDRADLGLDLVRLAAGKPHALLLSHSLYAEVRRVMHYPRLRALHGLDDAGIQAFLDDLVAAGELERLVAKHGDEVLPLAKRIGPDFVEGLERAGSHGDEVLTLFARRGDDALWTGEPGRLAMFVRYGSR